MDSWTLRHFEHEARALLGRLMRITPFVTRQVMVPAANVSPVASSAIEGYLVEGRRRLCADIESFLADLQPGGALSAQVPAQVQRRWTVLRLHFSAVVTQFDLFDDVLAQRGAADHGVWLAGLDVLASDALRLPGHIQAPPVVCYLDRGVGAAIRRARTRLPGGGLNPVAIIRMPRERLVGMGIASSLVHEVGHQAAALLGLVEPLRAELQQRAMASSSSSDREDEDAESATDAVNPWRLWARWISEIVADCWSVAQVGVASTLGLMGVVSLPRPFVFRMSGNDPHPFPWIRVMLSAAMGEALWPHPQWGALQRLWQQLYPAHELPAEQRLLLRRLQESIPHLVDHLLRHRPASLGGEPLMTVLDPESRHPDRLARLFVSRGHRTLTTLQRLSPALAMATLGQARMDGRLSPDQDSRLTRHLLGHWALGRSLMAISPARCEAGF